MSEHQNTSSERLNEVIIWGTGSLAERYLAVAPENVCVKYFVDSSKTGVFQGVEIIPPNLLVCEKNDTLLICSTFINDIIPICFATGFSESQIKIVMPRSLETVKLSHFSYVDSEYYYLPWKQQEDLLNLSLSSDIVFPDVYKELAKSAAYAYIAAVEGDFAEFGTCSGYTASLLANVMRYYSQYLEQFAKQHHLPPKTLCLFDSFQGFPASTKAPDLQSPHVESGTWGEGTAKGLSEKQLQSLCAQFLPAEHIQTYAGWYKETLRNIEQERTFAFVHMDCDLYESTYDVLYHLFSSNKLNEGAMLLFDNWYCNRASKDYGEQKAWAEINQLFDIECTHLGMYACVGHKLIIHRYAPK